MVKFMTDPRVVKNETKDMTFTLDNLSNPYLSRLVWIGTRRSNPSELMDEFGENFTLPEFRKRLGFGFLSSEAIYKVIISRLL